MELWKRKQSVLIWEWDLGNLEEDEENRPEFEASAKNFRTNPVTKEKEAYVPTWTRVFRYCVTAGVVLFMVNIIRIILYFFSVFFYLSTANFHNMKVKILKYACLIELLPFYFFKPRTFSKFSLKIFFVATILNFKQHRSTT